MKKMSAHGVTPALTRSRRAPTIPGRCGWRAACAAVLAGAGLLAADVTRADNYALLIGVGEFPRVQDSAINLPGIDVDLDKMQQMVTRLGVPQKNITRLFNAGATLGHVTQALRDHARRLDADDRLYLYMTTHGGQITNFSDDPEADGLDEFLVFHDLKMVPEPDPDTDATQTLEGVLLDDDLGLLLADIKATTIAIIDACSSATATKALNLSQATDTLTATGKFLSTWWMRKPGKRAVGVERGPYDIDARDNLVVLAASQDKQEAGASEDGSAYTNALFDALKQLPASAQTPFCLHHHAYREMKRLPENYFQDPALSGPFGIANRSLHDHPTTALAAFNQCLGGARLQLTKRKLERKHRSDWQLEFNNRKDAYLLGYIESERGMVRVKFSHTQRYAPGPLQLNASGIAADNSGAESLGAGLLIAHTDDSSMLQAIDFNRADWANQLNRHYLKLSSSYSEF